MQLEDSQTRTVHAGEIIEIEGRGILKTLLGTCTTVCVWHPARYAIMCHYLLPIHQPGYYFPADTVRYRNFKYGDVALTELFKRLEYRGLDKNQCKWWVVGGMKQSLFNQKIGQRNYKFARDFLQQANICQFSEHTINDPTVVSISVETGILSVATHSKNYKVIN